MKTFLMKIRTPDGRLFVCTCSGKSVSEIMLAAYDEFGVCGITVTAS